MCGKFTQMASWQEVVDFSQPLSEADIDRPAKTDEDSVVVSTPMRFANIMRLNAQGEREMVPMRWGFAERAADNPGKPKHMHVRCETIDTRPTFAESFAQRRGVCFVRTFNEGEELPNGKTKQWTISPKDRWPIPIAVIWEEWRNGSESLLTFVQVTTPANKLIGRITDRMPAVLRHSDLGIWLGETEAPLDQVKAALRTYEDDGAWEMAEEVKPSRQTKAGQPSKRPPFDDPQPGLF